MLELQHVQFTDSGKERFQEVTSFLEELNDQSQPVARQAREELAKQLGYLDDYGGPVSDDDPRRRFKVVLGRDWSPLSFTIIWYRLDFQTGEYVYAFQGGLIWHGGANDPLCVSVTPCLFGIHT